MKPRRFLALLLALTMLTLSLAGCGGENEPAQEAAPDYAALLQKAYTYTLPLMVMDATFVSSTNTVEATPYKAPVNQFLHAENLATADFTAVVTPNVDTIYSQVFLDVSAEPVILTFPKTDRFCTVEVLDAWSNCIAVLDATTFERDSQQVIFTGADFDGTIPDGMEEVACPTSMLWIIVRTICNDADDEANVHAIQAQMDAYTLSQYEAGTTAEKAPGTYDEAEDIIPSQHVLTMDMETYFTRANALMTANPPTEADAPLLEEIAAVNVGPGLTFDPSLFGEDADALWTNIVTNIVDTTTAGSTRFIQANGSWSYFGQPIAEFGTEYDYRAFIALVGFGANPVSIAVYPKTTQDADGGRLNGTNNYVLHFEPDQIPAVEENGFWSVTAYNSDDNFLIDNELDRYCINDRSDVVYNEDGSLDVYIQTDAPESGTGNWLPVGEEDFHLVLRVYLPVEEIVNNEWTAPSILKTAE